MILVLYVFFSLSVSLSLMRSIAQDTPCSLAERLANSGLRNTPQREVVYRALLERRDHPTADEVFTAVRGASPRQPPSPHA